MTFTAYQPPGVDVMIERSEVVVRSAETEFYTVYVGTGVTARNKSIARKKVIADTSKFPLVKLTFDLLGDINTDLFAKTKFTLGQMVVSLASPPQEGSPNVVLEPSTGYTITQNVTFSPTDSSATVVINISDESVTANDKIYDVNLTASYTDKDFDLREIGSADRFFSKEILGPIVLEEDSVEFYNDIAIAAEIAFRLRVPRFYYLEVPRDFGQQPTLEDYKAAFEKIYYASDAYRIVPLTSDEAVHQALNTFIKEISNPLDRRESVGFVTYDMSKIEEMDDITELVEKVGGFSESLDNKRMNNIFVGRTADLKIGNQVYVLPEYFFPAAVAAYDAVIGKVDPLSLREIELFESVDAPRFRPKHWDLLAAKGVFILTKEIGDEPMVVRHQLTTAQSNKAEDQEYSIVKNFDVVTKKIRDRFKPYAGSFNIEAGYLERLEGTLATVRQEVIEEKLARNLTILTPWSQKDSKDGRNLVCRLSMQPVYPANHLEIYLVI